MAAREAAELIRRVALIRRIVLASVLSSVAALALGATAAHAAVNTFSSPSAISIPESGQASPYPSSIAVGGLSGQVQKATVTLLGFSHTCPHDVDVLLVGPSGADSILFARLGPGLGCPDSTNADLTFDQGSGGTVPYPPVNGTYKPTQGETPSPFAAPAPAGPYPVTLDGFNGTEPNGTWKLFVQDDFGGDSGSISGGWSLTLNGPVPVPPPAAKKKCKKHKHRAASIAKKHCKKKKKK
jgi:subtilisin-like proprotein convertase family protein